MISENKELNRLLFQLSKKMLEHRNGTEYEVIYAVDEELNSDYYKLVLADYYNDGYNEYEAQIMAIKEMSSKFEIMFKEVTAL